MRFSVSLLATTVAGAAVVAAQNSTGISPACQAALVKVGASPDAACLNPAGLAAIASTAPDQSLIPNINTWLTGICAIAPCTNASLAAVFNNIVAGCPQETANWNITVQDVQTVYPTARKIACLKDSSDGQLCVVQTLKNIEGVAGILSPNNLPNVVNNVISGATAIPPSVVCTNCNKAAFNIIEQDFPTLDPQVATDLSATCGASFVDGQAPASITNSGVSARRRFGRFYIN